MKRRPPIAITAGRGGVRSIANEDQDFPLAQRDVEHGLDVTLNYFKTPDAQQRALDILRFKLDILWSMLDAIEKGYPV
jgi:hypothetical protein